MKLLPSCYCTKDLAFLYGFISAQILVKYKKKLFQNVVELFLRDMNYITYLPCVV